MAAEYGTSAFPWPFSESTSQLIDLEVRRILDECYVDAVTLLRQHRDALDRLAQCLLEQDTLDEQEILLVTGLPRAPRLETLPMHIGADAAIAGTLPAAAMITPVDGCMVRSPGSN